MNEILKASQMVTERTMMPGDPGSKKWIKQYGDKLICIRYRYDGKRKLKVKTVELIVEEKPHVFSSRKIPHNENLFGQLLF